jgi:hypothetical protein
MAGEATDASDIKGWLLIESLPALLVADAARRR